MKNLKFILLSLAVVLGIAACQKTVVVVNYSHPYSYIVPQNDKGEFGIVFGNYSAATKATVESISKTGYDNFKLYAWNSNGDTIMNPYLVSATGPYIYKYDNIENQTLQYFRNVANSYEFIGVIPVDNNMVINKDTVTVFDVVSEVIDDERVDGILKKDSPNEFLYAYTKVNKSEYGNPVTLQFNHGNSLIYLGFSSDRNDTKLLDYVPGKDAVPATPDQNDTTDTWFNLKRSTNVDGSATKTRVKVNDFWGNYVDNYELPAELVNEIKSYYSIDGGDPGDYDLHLGATVWPSNVIKKLRVVKEIPVEYRMTVDIHGEGIFMDFFDGFKYLKDNGYDIQPKNSGGKPAIWDYVLLDAFVNGAAYTVIGFNWSAAYSVPSYTIETIPGTPEIPGIEPIKGVRLFTAKIENEHYVHDGYHLKADAKISSNGLKWENAVDTTGVVIFSLPENVILNSEVVYSPSTFYMIPSDIDNLVVKLSYEYKGIKAYDVRVPIQLPNLGEGKYYKYTIHITSTGNGHNDRDKAKEDENEIDVVNNPVITVNVNFSDYNVGDEQVIII